MLLGILPNNASWKEISYERTLNKWLVTNKELIDFMRGKIELNRIPRYYIYLDALPVNDVGKPDLNAIMEIAATAEKMEKEIVK